MQHVDAFVCLDTIISAVTHEQLNELNVTMEAREMQRIEALLRL